MKKGLFGKYENYRHLPDPMILLGLLYRFDNRYQSAADSVFEELSWKQLFCLKVVSLFTQPPTIQDMADFMGCSHQNANKLCTRLLRWGYLTAEQDGQDRRKQRLFLTEKAGEFLRLSQEKAGDYMGELFSVVTQEELDVVIDVMARLTRRLDTLHGKAPHDDMRQTNL